MAFMAPQLESMAMHGSFNVLLMCAAVGMACRQLQLPLASQSAAAANLL
jgi:hypothetical protein